MPDIDPSKWPTAVQVLAAVAAWTISTLLAMFGVRRRHPVDEDIQKLRDEVLGRRLRDDLQAVLEANRVSLQAALEEHRRQIHGDFSQLDERLRDVEISLARLAGRQK